MPLYLREADVAELLTTADALAAVEDSFHRLARGAVDNRPRERLPLEGGMFAVMGAPNDSTLGSRQGTRYGPRGIREASVGPVFNKYGYPQLAFSAVTDRAPELAKRWPNSFWFLGTSKQYVDALVALLSQMRKDGKINDNIAMVSIADGFGIDLSKAAAGVLGMQNQGVAKVKVTVLGRS